jgi:putative membrane protein
MTGWGWGWMALMMTVGILLVALLVLVLVRGSVSRPQSEDRDDPTQILAQRLARGEIDEAEYRRRLSVLRSADRSPAH